MLGLDNYSSSDEEDRSRDVKSSVKAEEIPPPRSRNAVSGPIPADTDSQEPNTAATTETPPAPRPKDSVAQSHEPRAEPIVGPSGPPPSPGPANGSTSRPQSPYSSTRSLIRDLTLPPVPNLDIPPSPPGSPPASTNAKFAHFLELKRQGNHFNEKLARSSALRNPSLLPKLMAFAGMQETEQYSSTLPKEVWDPAAFPSWAYKEELARSQQEVTRRREDERMTAQRDAVEFVPATAAGASGQGAAGPETRAERGSGRSAAERVMAGLDRDRTKSPSMSDGDKRRQYDRRGVKSNGYRGRERSRSRSPSRRKRSRSR